MAATTRLTAVKNISELGCKSVSKVFQGETPTVFPGRMQGEIVNLSKRIPPRKEFDPPPNGVYRWLVHWLRPQSLDGMYRF